MKKSALCFLYILSLFPPVLAQEHHGHHSPNADSLKQDRPHETGASHAMSHAFSLSLPMNRNGSGTGWLPDHTPMYGYTLHGRKWMYMFHGNVFLRYTNQDIFRKGKRGGSKIDAPNWFMAMGQRRIGKNGLFRFSAMLSLDILTVGGGGYPLLFQSGETWKGKPLVDRQHPHDLFSELSVAYTHRLNPDMDVFVYLAYPGEPALGPVAFMHRVSGLPNPDAPLGHHWQDATHITFGVASGGFRYKMLKLEGSLFTGREPDEERYGFDKPRFDSWSMRLSFNPSPEWALQLSQARVNDLHALGPRENMHKTTASVFHSKRMSRDRFLNSAVVWGFNNPDSHGKSHALLAETAFSMGASTVYGKYEWVQKSSEDLLLGNMFGHDALFGVQGITVGFQQNLVRFLQTNLAAGVQLSWFPTVSPLRSIYGSNPAALQVYTRLYPHFMR